MGRRDFLAGLDITDDERRQLAGRGATSAKTLLLMINASREPFREMFGDRAEHIERSLLASLSSDDRASLADPLPPRHPLGASLGPAPPVTPRASDLQRNQLQDELQRLRASSDRSSATQQRILMLQRQLDALLDIGPHKNS